jgi:hypothetical protein
MKKLLQKWFPSYFNICKHTWIDHEKLSEGNYAVTQIEESQDRISEVFGISPERYKELVKRADKAFMSTDTITGALEMASPICKHPNELAMLTIAIWDRKVNNNGLPPGIADALIKGILGSGGPKDED